jgi:4,5-DOPA dioxygenase extradiol
MEFDAWAQDALERRAIDELLDFRAAAPAATIAHPTVDHFVPIFVTVGAGDLERNPAVTKIDGYTLGFSRRSFELE